MANSFGPGLFGQNTTLNISAATVIKATPGVLYSISVTTAGSATGAVYDAATTGGNIAANLVGVIPSAASSAPYAYNWRCLTGILIVPPTGGTVSVNFV